MTRFERDDNWFAHAKKV